MKWFGITSLALMLIVHQQSPVWCQTTPSLVFERVNPGETNLLGEARAWAQYYIAPPNEEPVSDDDDTGLYSDNDAWEAGTIAGILLGSSAYGETVDAFAEYSNLTATTDPDGQIIANVTGIHDLNFWNEASFYANSDVGASSYSDSQTIWKIVDPDPEDAFVPPESVTVTGSIEATWLFGGTASDEEQQVSFDNYAGWVVYKGNEVMARVDITAEGAVFLDNVFWGAVDWDGDDISIPFEFEAQEDEEIEINHWVYGAAGASCNDGSAMGGGGIVWGVFTTLPAP